MMKKAMTSALLSAFLLTTLGVELALISHAEEPLKIAGVISTVRKRTTDAQIRTALRYKLLESKTLDNTDIKIDCTNGQVILYGAVSTNEQKMAAQKIAAQVQNVTKVTNQLVVTGLREKNQTLLQRGLQELDDGEIANTVRVKLITSGLIEGNRIQVKALNGAVVLDGFVRTEQQSAQAGKIATETSGVIKVINKLKLRP